QDFYVSGNLTVYYSLNQRKSEDFRGPDFFVVLGTERRERRSWAVWQEGGKLPNVIVEILSSSTAAIDRGLKKQIYQDVLRVPNYFWFDPITLELKGFNLIAGQYQEVQPTEQGWLWSQQLDLYLSVRENRLRFLTPEGQVVLTEAELGREQASLAHQQAGRAEQRADRAEQRASDAEQKAERLAEYLRRQNIDPDGI
ncbi:MAG: Uma2 family endonuclease, partial [Gemmatimonadaceae bacterium]|nr:Uma2 family endonuclease [Gloeobacterales cyanobacterium ES-bin-141]